MITLDGNQHFTENKTFGDAYDVGTKDTYAQNMVIVKVNGDLEIDKGVTVAPYYTEYGGPKGFTLYVTGKLTNKGTIDNSHGAKAEGQNVYLWKNTDGSYEYVPKAGASINNSSTPAPGRTGTGRQTGSGGNAISHWGSAGTSYSGGSGAGSYGDAESNGREGGPGSSSAYGSGAGNPGGSNTTMDAKGQNGTGGLLSLIHI